VAEIRNRQDNPGPSIDYSEIYIPDEQDFGKGIYTAVLQPDILANGEPVTSWAVNTPVFQISLNVDPTTEEISVLLGKADGGPPSARRVFSFPENIGKPDTYTFETHFVDWQIEELTLNGIDCISKYDLEL